MYRNFTSLYQEFGRAEKLHRTPPWNDDECYRLTYTADMRFIPTFMLICVLSACATPTATLVPSLPKSFPPMMVPATATTVPPLAGKWIGSATKPDGSTASIQINIAASETTLIIEPFTRKISSTFMQKDYEIRFVAMGVTGDSFQQIEFNGVVSIKPEVSRSVVLTGTFKWDDVSSPIIFFPIQSIDTSTLTKYEGLYRFDSGRALSIIVSPQYTSGGLKFFSDTLMLTDFESGALRALYPIDDSTFLIGALRVVGAPFGGKIQFITDAAGNVIGLNWWDAINAQSSERAVRVEYQQEDITFTCADGTKLAGRFSIRATGTVVPAFMMMHGSERGTKDDFGDKVMAHYMISQGFAILNYDKRGVGDSEGVYQERATTSNLQKHAEDAIAGVEYLASQSGIDKNRIGLIGFSQAGWVIPLAASQSEAITHFVIISGPVESVAQEDRFSNYTNDGDSSTTYDDAKITQQLRDMQPGGFDPLPIIADLNQPGLWLWGGMDKSVPVTFSAENLQAIINSGKSNFSYQIFPSGDHNLNASPRGLFAEIPYSPGVLFYSELAKWLAANMPTK